MTEDELRALVREAIARVSGSDPAHRPYQGIDTRREDGLTPLQHASFTMFPVPSGADMDGPCVIEPTVLCSHCGYCKSYGH